MKTFIKLKAEILPRKNLLASLLLLMLIAASISGVTYAWFAGVTRPIQNVFTIGTVELSKPVIINNNLNVASANDSNCQTLQWQFKSTGTKTTYVRVLPEAEATAKEGTDTAWVGIPSSEKPHPNNFDTPFWSQYFEYDSGSYSSSNKLGLDILAGSNYNDVGDAEIWHDHAKLYIELWPDSNFTIEEIHIYAGLEKPDNSAPGQLGWTFDDGPYGSYLFETDKLYDEQGGNKNKDVSDLNGEIVYIAVHISGSSSESQPVEVPVTIELCSHDEGNWIQGVGGWWYYGDETGPTTVNAGSTVTVCLRYCVDGDYKDVTMTTALNAEAVQRSNYAIDEVWSDPPHPWHPSLE